MDGVKRTPALYDRRRLRQLVMEQRMKALLQTRKSVGGKKHILGGGK